jgi:hypothetical protein
VARWRVRPAAKGFDTAEEEEDKEETEPLWGLRRCDSARRRRSSRSWARREGASSGRVLEEDLLVGWLVDDEASWSGGREDYIGH